MICFGKRGLSIIEAGTAQYLGYLPKLKFDEISVKIAKSLLAIKNTNILYPEVSFFTTKFIAFMTVGKYGGGGGYEIRQHFRCETTDRLSCGSIVKLFLYL